MIDEEEYKAKSKRKNRRHHRERLKKKRKDYWAMGFNRDHDQLEPEVEEKLMGMIVNTPHPCSKMCCGNKRQYEGSPMREKRQPNKKDFE